MDIKRLQTRIILFSILGSIVLLILYFMIRTGSSRENTQDIDTPPVPMVTVSYEPYTKYSSDPDAIVVNHAPPGDTIIISSIHNHAPGFVIVKKGMTDDKNSPILGVSTYLTSGTHEDIHIHLKERLKDADHVVFMLIEDHGDTIYGLDDTAVTNTDGSPISTSITVEEEES